MEFYDEIIEIKRKPQISSNTPDKKMSSAIKKDIPTAITAQSTDDADRTTTKRPSSSLPRKGPQQSGHDASETDSSDSESETHAENLADGFNYKQWESLNVSSEVKDLYQYIAKFVHCLFVWSNAHFPRRILTMQILTWIYFLDIHQQRSIYRIDCSHLYRILYQLLAISMHSSK